MKDEKIGASLLKVGPRRLFRFAPCLFNSNPFFFVVIYDIESTIRKSIRLSRKATSSSTSQPPWAVCCSPSDLSHLAPIPSLFLPMNVSKSYLFEMILQRIKM